MGQTWPVQPLQRRCYRTAHATHAGKGISLCLQIDALERSVTADYISLLGFCHNDLQYGNMLLHTTAHRSLSFNSLRSHSIERAVRGGSPPTRGGSPCGGPHRRPEGDPQSFGRSATPLDVEG